MEWRFGAVLRLTKKARPFLPMRVSLLNQMRVRSLIGKERSALAISYSYDDRTNDREENCDRSTEGAQVPTDRVRFHT
jgi:hypothetical protein